MKTFYFIPLLLVSSVATAQSGKSPCPRNQPVIVYHQKEKAIYLFGGYCSQDKKRLNDLWKFDGETWISKTTKNAPPPRSGHSMIYDNTENRLLIFGGKNDRNELLNDTWIWNGEKWEEISGNSPSPRQSHRMIYDTRNSTVMLFGGSDANGEALNDTWLFSDNLWVKSALKNRPEPRLQHTMCYDPFRDQVVLFGGFSRNNGEKQIFGDTWEWQSDVGWVLKANDPQLARDHHAMVYDIKRKETILFGGYNQRYLGDSWRWDGNNWLKLFTDDDLARAGKPGLVFDASYEVVVLFGGWDRSNKPLMDFWKLNVDQQFWDQY